MTNSRPHIIMVTNHGIHDWEVRSGLQDTGGQNHYVNQLTDALVKLDSRVTIFNRGGFPDPVTGKRREGVHPKNENARIVYLEGGGNHFIRKEDLTKEILAEEAEHAATILRNEGAATHLLISHYWDGAILARMLKEKCGFKAKHIWIPHSLGSLKRDNFRGKSADVIAACRFEERIALEREVLPHLDAVASTSGDISRVLSESYGRTPELFLPPCIDTDVVHPLDAERCRAIYDFLTRADPTTGKTVRGRPCVLEVSRTDRTKRKDIVVRAFAKATKHHPEAMLLLTLSPDNEALYREMMDLIASLGIRKQIVLIGMVPRELISELYAITTVYLSPSEMEGFGMSVQEAAASRRAVITSNLVPFAVEYLEKNDAAIIVPAGDGDGFARALENLLGDKEKRDAIAARAYRTTIPAFTWPEMTKNLLDFSSKLGN